MTTKRRQKAKKKSKKKELESGYTLDVLNGAACHFEHIPIEEAERLTAPKEGAHVVETINWTIGDGDASQVHLNKYFALNLADALALAVRIELQSGEVAEEVVCVRAASEKEAEETREATLLLLSQTPEAIPEKWRRR